MGSAAHVTRMCLSKAMMAPRVFNKADEIYAATYGRAYN